MANEPLSSPSVSSKSSIPSWSTKWCYMNFSSNCSLNSSQVRVSNRLGVSCFWDIHHSHVCSTGFEWNESIPCQFRSVVFPYTPLLGATTVAPTWFWSPTLQRSLVALPWWWPWQNPHLGHWWWHPNLLQCDSSTWLSLGFMLQLPLVEPKTHKRCP